MNIAPQIIQRAQPAPEFIAPAAPAPAPAAAPAPIVAAPPVVAPATCDLTGDADQTDCAAKSHRFCGNGVTSSITACRRVFKQFCEGEETFEDAESCKRAKCDGLTAPGHSNAKVRTDCRFGENKRGGGVGALCELRVCRRAPAPIVAAPVVAAPTCAIPAARSVAECQQVAQDACSGGVTSTFQICRNVVSKLCREPRGFADAAICVQNHCDSLNGDAGHPTEVVRAVCKGTFDTKRIPAGQLKYFPRGIPAKIDGISQLCAQVTCPVPPPVPAPVTVEEVRADPVQVPPVKEVADAFTAQNPGQNPAGYNPAPAAPVEPAAAPVEPPAAPAAPVEPPAAPAAPVEPTPVAVPTLVALPTPDVEAHITAGPRERVEYVHVGLIEECKDCALKQRLAKEIDQLKFLVIFSCGLRFLPHDDVASSPTS